MKQSYGSNNPLTIGATAGSNPIDGKLFSLKKEISNMLKEHHNSSQIRLACRLKQNFKGTS